MSVYVDYCVNLCVMVARVSSSKTRSSLSPLNADMAKHAGAPRVCSMGYVNYSIGQISLYFSET